MTHLIQDLTYAVRTLIKAPAFALVALVALALGIGANTAIFSMVHAVMLRPLPYPQPERLVMVWEDYQRRGGPQREWTNPANFDDWRRQNQVFDELFFITGWGPTLTGDGEPEQLNGAVVSHGMFATLGVQPALGRAFTADEDRPNGERVAVLSHALWRQRFGGDPGVIGRVVTLSGNPFTIIGVMPEAFRFPVIANAQLWAPAQLEPGQRGNAFLRVIGRLKADVSLSQAQAEMSTIAARLEQEYPDTNAGTGIYLAGLQADLAGPARPALLVLLGAVAFVLLIACANVANLLLARAGTRQREVAVRMALGATRGRLMRQFLTESVVLSVLGGALGLLLAFWVSDSLAVVAPNGLPQPGGTGIDASVLGFTLLVSVLTGLVFGTAPALDATRVDLHVTMKEGGRGSPGGRQALRRLLVVSEVALSLVLLVGAGLLMKSFYMLLHVDPGFNPKNAIVMTLVLPQSKYEEAEQTLSLYARLLEAVRALPGVQAAGAVNNLPLGDGHSDTTFIVEGRPIPNPDQRPHAWFSPVTTGYFEAMGIRLLRGRGFDQHDTAQAGRVIVINESMAKEFWPGENPVGKRIGTGIGAPQGPTWREVVGVVGNVHSFGLDREEPSSMYFPHEQVPSRRMNVVVRTAGDPLALAASLRSTVWRFDPDLAIPSMQTLEQVIAGSVSERRFTMFLLAAFSALALLLASIGLYGVMAFAVTRRTREIGIRIALGARPGEVMRLILGQGLALTAVGLGVGVILALALGRGLSALLFGIAPHDPATLAAVVATLAGVAALASYIPARRAMRVDPVIALRHE